MAYSRTFVPAWVFRCPEIDGNAIKVLGAIATDNDDRFLTTIKLIEKRTGLKRACVLAKIRILKRLDLIIHDREGKYRGYRTCFNLDYHEEPPPPVVHLRRLSRSTSVDHKNLKKEVDKDSLTTSYGPRAWTVSTRSA